MVNSLAIGLGVLFTVIMLLIARAYGHAEAERRAVYTVTVCINLVYWITMGVQLWR